MPARVHWTEEMIATLRQLREAKVSLYDCAQRIGVAYPTAVYKARELGIAARLPHKNARKQEEAG